MTPNVFYGARRFTIEAFPHGYSEGRAQKVTISKPGAPKPGLLDEVARMKTLKAHPDYERVALVDSTAGEIATTRIMEREPQRTNNMNKLSRLARAATVFLFAALTLNVIATDDPRITTGRPQTGDNNDMIQRRIAYSYAQWISGTAATNSGAVAGLTCTAAATFYSVDATNASIFRGATSLRGAVTAYGLTVTNAVVHKSTTEMDGAVTADSITCTNASTFQSAVALQAASTAASLTTTNANTFKAGFTSANGDFTNRVILRGAIRTPFIALTCTNGTNYAAGFGTAVGTNCAFARVTGPTGAFVLAGLPAGNDGDRITVLNLVAQNLTFAHENGDETAANRITTLTGSDVTTTAAGAGELIYDTTTSRWILYNATQ